MQTWPEGKFAVVFFSVEKPLKRTRETEKENEIELKLTVDEGGVGASRT